MKKDAMGDLVTFLNRDIQKEKDVKKDAIVMLSRREISMIQTSKEILRNK